MNSLPAGQTAVTIIVSYGIGVADPFDICLIDKDHMSQCGGVTPPERLLQVAPVLAIDARRRASDSSP
jgi:hypothetical protein